MTIRTRNRFIIFFMFISLMLLLGAGIITGLDYFSGNFAFPTSNPFTFMQNNFLFKFNFLTVVFSIFAFLFYTSFFFLFITIEFEKTQSNEIIFFSVFLLGCLSESIRLLVPVLNMWNNITTFTLFCTRTIIFGRICATVALLFSVICSSPDYRQYIEQNILIIFSGSLVIAILIPLNSYEMYPTGIISWGFGRLLRISMICILCVAIVSQFIKSFSSTHRTTMLAVGLLLISIGYYILCSSYNYFFLFSGFIPLFGGTFIYLKFLHKQYLWT